ncbi:hypothetical protein F5146DRAFT_1003191 [Armillaria mellea]|nr:hypothetical protein F5146DRAFT_1003191 [Armillaria mellea]
MTSFVALSISLWKRSRGIYISATFIILPCDIDAACIPPDEALSVNYTPPPEVDSSQLVYKRLVLTPETDKDVKLERRRRDILQRELDCLGFRTDWIIQGKVFLALTLMDALLDFEQDTLEYARQWRGVECSDAVRALYNMTMAISELFLSGTTSAISCEEAVPLPFIQLIEWCKEDAFGSVAEMMAKTGADPRPRVKNMSASVLAEAWLLRCKALAKSEDEWWLGREYDSDPGKYYCWVPKYFELPCL